MKAAITLPPPVNEYVNATGVGFKTIVQIQSCGTIAKVVERWDAYSHSTKVLEFLDGSLSCLTAHGVMVKVLPKGTRIELVVD